MMRSLRLALSVVALAVGITACAGGSSADGSTSWLSSCGKSSECRRGLSCICGKCTRTCDSSRECDALGTGAVCESARVLGARCASGVETDLCARGSSGSASADASAASGTAPGAILEGGAGSRAGDAGSPPSATADGSLPDGGISCTEDQECNDHDFCNGVETCVPGLAGKTCRRGTAVADGAVCGEDHACMAGACRSLSTCNLSATGQ
jgi:hypothetical protein